MSTGEHHITAPEDRIRLQQKLAYAVGMFVNNLQAAALPAMMVILNLGLGMNPFLVGLIAAIPRAFDAISDPLVGSISDRWRSRRLGRRHPFLYSAPLPAALCFLALFFPPETLEGGALFTWLVVFSVLLRFAMTFFQVPRLALGGELRVPPNLVVIGTMNSVDRSVALVDYALRRRFGFIRVDPDPDVITKVRGKGVMADIGPAVLEKFNAWISKRLW